MDQDLQEVDIFELSNDIITVSKLQIALRTKARTLQTRLSQLAAGADTRSIEGLFSLLQQTATLLLEYSDFWSHVVASSETVDSRETAQDLFYQLLLQERNKSGVATAPELNGTAPVIDLAKHAEKGSHHNDSTYIVVTFLLSTADDRPLFQEIYTGSLLKDVLQEITMMRSSYLIVFELLWRPQTSEPLNEEILAAEYGDMIAIS